MSEVKLRINLSTLKMSIEADGFQGGECIEELDRVQELLGVETVSSEDKPEMVIDVSQTEISQG